MSTSDCTCLLCCPLEGRRAHPEYGYDLDKVPTYLCYTCGLPIGDAPYVEILGMARFGQMRLQHAACETPKAAKARERMAAHAKKRREKEHQ